MGSWTFIIIQTYAFRYNYRSQNWKNVISLSFLSFPRFFVSGTNFPDENSQKKTRKSVTLETQRPIKTFRLLIDVREIVFTCYTPRFTVINDPPDLQPLNNNRVKPKRFFELLTQRTVTVYKGCCNKGYSFYSRSFGFAYKW